MACKQRYFLKCVLSTSLEGHLILNLSNSMSGVMSHGEK